MNKVCAFVMLVSACFANVALAEDAVRVWVDQSGTYSIEASLVRVAGDNVVLLKRDGTRVQIAVSNLSEKDLDYVENARANMSNQLRAEPPAPPEIRPLEVLDLPPAATVAQDGASLKLDASNSQIKRTSLPKSIEPDRAPYITYASEKQFHMGAIKAYQNCSAPIAVGGTEAPALAVSISVGYSLHDETTKNKLVRFDLESGKSSVIWSGAERVTLLDHHAPSNRSLTLVGHNALGHGGKFAIATGWDRGSISYDHRLALPDSGQIGKSSQVRWAKMLDEENVIALVDQSLVAFNIVSGKTHYQINRIHRSSKPAISGGRRYIAVPTDAGVDLYGTIKGDSLGRIGTEAHVVPAVSFSKLGDALAIVTSRRLRVWNLEAASLQADLECRRSLGGDQPVWIDHDLILSGNGVLLSLFRGVPVWQYDIVGAKICSIDEHCAILRKHPSTGLSVMRLPHLGAVDAMEWIDTVQNVAKSESWRVPGRSIWAGDRWQDRDVRLGSRDRDLR